MPESFVYKLNFWGNGESFDYVGNFGQAETRTGIDVARKIRSAMRSSSSRVTWTSDTSGVGRSMV